jgi:ABC-type sugar transport system permease subunit
MKKSLSYKSRREITGILLCIPSFIIIFIFFLYPIILSAVNSFTDWDGVSSTVHFVGLKNFSDVIHDNSFLQICWNTVYLAILYIPVLNILALIFGVMINGIRKKIGNIFKSVMFFPNLLSMVVVGFIWKLMYDFNFGLINQTLGALHLNFLQFDWLGTPGIVKPALSASIIWFAMGYYMIIYLAGIVAIPSDLYECASVEGAGSFKKFYYITLPMLAPSITINVVLSTIGIMSTFDLPFVLTAGGPGYMSETLALKVYHYAYSSIQEGRSLALAMILCIFSIVITLVELGLLRKREDIY